MSNVIVTEPSVNNVVINSTVNVVDILATEPNVVSISSGSNNITVVKPIEPNVVLVATSGVRGASGVDGIFSEIASQLDATTGTNNTKGMTPLRSFESNNAWVTTKNEQDLSGIPLSQSITYNNDDTVATIVKNGVTKTFSYTAGILASISDGTYLKSFVYTNSLLTNVNITIL